MNHIIDKYYKNLAIILNKVNNIYLYSLPGIFRLNYRVDKNSSIKSINKQVLANNFAIKNVKNFKKSSVIFISHYLGNTNDLDKDFYYGKIFKYLEKKINFGVILINKTNQKPNDIIKKNKKKKNWDSGS